MKRWKMLALAAALPAVWAAGCASGQEDAEALLKRTIAAVRQSGDLAYDGRAEVRLAGVTLQPMSLDSRREDGAAQMPLHPLEALRQLDDMRHAAAIEPAAGREQEQERVLRVSVDDQEWTAFVRKQWEERIGDLQRASQRLVEKSRGSLPPAQAGKLERELTETSSLAGKRMDELLAGMKAKGAYRIWINRSTHLPTRMIVESTMSYGEEDSEKSETIVYSFDFR